MQRMSLIGLVSVLCLFPGNSGAEPSTVKMSAAADFVGNLEAKGQNKYPKRLDLREAEFSFFAPIDHAFEANLGFAAHNEGGVYNLEVHEAYLSSAKLVQNMRFKLGKFFLGVGRLNQLHRHDWPFITAPKAHEIFFDEEAVADTGVQTNILLPSLPIYTDIALGITNGWVYGHSHSQGSKPVRPLHYLRIGNFFSLGENGGLSTGLNYLARNSKTEGALRIFGLDSIAKWREGKYVTTLLQMELYGHNLRAPGAALQRAFGGYLYGQKNIKGPFDFGLRFDAYTLVTTGKKNLDYSFVPIFSYKNSEFLQFRASHQWDFEKRDHKDSQVSRAFQVQAIFILGEHPSHDF